MVSISVTVCARMARFGKCPYTGAFDQYIIVEDTGSALWLGRRGVLLEREREGDWDTGIDIWVG